MCADAKDPDTKHTCSQQICCEAEQGNPIGEWRRDRMAFCKNISLTMTMTATSTHRHFKDLKFNGLRHPLWDGWSINEVVTYAHT